MNKTIRSFFFYIFVAFLITMMVSAVKEISNTTPESFMQEVRQTSSGSGYVEFTSTSLTTPEIKNLVPTALATVMPNYTVQPTTMAVQVVVTTPAPSATPTAAPTERLKDGRDQKMTATPCHYRTTYCAALGGQP